MTRYEEVKLLIKATQERLKEKGKNVAAQDVDGTERNNVKDIDNLCNNILNYYHELDRLTEEM